MSDKCQICDFYHEWNEPCREAESIVAGDGFIAFKDGLYIKPLSDEKWNERVAEIGVRLTNKKKEIFKKRNNIKNRLYRLRDRTASANDQISYDLVNAIINDFSSQTGGLTELQIMSLNSINEIYPGI